MALIPEPQHTTVAAIYQAYKDANESWDSLGISVGELGTECDRALWFSFRWTAKPEDIDGRKISIFRTGDMWEGRLVKDLESIGCTVWDQQERIRFVSDHVRGQIDGKVVGIPEAPVTEHLAEFKSSNDKNFKLIVKDGVKSAKPLHHVQLQLGMHAFGLTRALYVVINKDSDERYVERVEYDLEFCIRILARAERIILAPEPPSRLCSKRDDFRGMFCKHAAVCWAEAWSRVTCRSCLHSTPEMGGSGHWSCARWQKPISFDEQKEACPTHLFVPQLVPGEMLGADDEAETVTYRLADGSLFVDGSGQGVPA